MLTKTRHTIFGATLLIIANSASAAAFPMYRDFLNNQKTSCQCNYLIFLDKHNSPQRLVVDLGSPMLLISNPNFLTQSKNKQIFGFLYGSPPPFQYYVKTAKFNLLQKSLSFSPLSLNKTSFGLAEPKMEKAVQARGIIGLAPYSNIKKFGMNGVINQLNLHKFSIVFPTTDLTHGTFFTHPLPKKDTTSQNATFKLVGLKSPVSVFGYFLDVKSLAFKSESGKTITFTNTPKGLMYSDQQHPNGIKVGTHLYGVIDNGNSDFPDFFNYLASPTTTKLQDSYITAHGKAPESIVVTLNDASGNTHQITLRIPKSFKWAFATPALKIFINKKSANIPLAFNFSLGFLEHFNLNFSLNHDYTQGEIQFICKDKYCTIG